MSEVGAELGSSEDAAKKRVHRAVEKLRLFFTRRGLALSAGVLTMAISANAVQAAPIGLAKAVTTVAVATGGAAGGAVAAFCKGILKPLLGTPAAVFAPIVGSVFFLLKAEVETAKSPRERRFLVRMIWLRFVIALLGTAAPLVIGFAMPSFVRQPGVIEFGFAGYFLVVALEHAARTTYFLRRRRQIQIEDGTWESFDAGEPANSDAFLSDLTGRSSKANRYAALAALFGLATSVLLAVTWGIQMMAAGRWIIALLVLGWGAHASFRWLRGWRQRPRQIFDARLSNLMKPVIFCAVLSLFAFDLSWAQGRIQPSWEWAITFNILVAVVYAVLLKVFATTNPPLPPRESPAMIH